MRQKEREKTRKSKRKRQKERLRTNDSRLRDREKERERMHHVLVRPNRSCYPRLFPAGKKKVNEIRGEIDTPRFLGYTRVRSEVRGRSCL